MGGVHPDAFQYALTPIPRNGVVCIGVVPIDGRRATIEGYNEYDPSGEKVLPTRIRSTKRYFSKLFVHKFGSFCTSVILDVFSNLLLFQTQRTDANWMSGLCLGVIRTVCGANYRPTCCLDARRDRSVTLRSPHKQIMKIIMNFVRRFVPRGFT